MMVVPATAALTAVATTHALILAVSHVLQFYQPLLLFVELTCLRNINRRPVHCSHHTMRSRHRPWSLVVFNVTNPCWLRPHNPVCRGASYPSP